MSWSSRLKLCWNVLTRGVYNPEDYKSKEEQRRWDSCRKRDKEMNACIRPRTEVGENEYGIEQ